MQTVKDAYRRSRWFMPAFAGVLGLIVFAAQWIGGDPTGGVISLGIMLGFAALLLLLEGRSGAIAVMNRPAVDERARRIDLHATAFAGVVLVTVVIGMFLYEVARGRDPSPYAQLGAVGGLSYLAALVIMQRRG
jgi:hypothetical protein